MEDLVAWADIIGTVAGILVLSSFIPQIVKAYKTKKMADVSIHLMSLIATGMLLWFYQIRSSYNWNQCYGVCS
jgi:MtN3 and saliva related transmembrane protein